MPQAKKKTTTKTAAKRQACPAKKCTKTACKKKEQNEKYHIYLVAALSMIAAILLCADVVFMMA